MPNSSGKRIREIVGYTHQAMAAKHDHWFTSALSLHDAAVALHQKQDEITGGFRVFVFNAALSLELIFKAILAAEKQPILKTHRLRDLSAAAKVTLDADQKITLDLLTEILIWQGRYPVPLASEDWDSFHDGVWEKILVRSRSANRFLTRAHPKRFPSLDNYINIWDACRTRYVSIVS